MTKGLGLAYAAAIFFVLALLLFVAPANAGYPDFEVIATRTDPSPIQPGIYFELSLTVQNTGTDEVQNLTLELVPKYPFSLDPGEEVVKYFGRVIPPQDVMTTYKLRVAGDAVEGWNEVELKVRGCPLPSCAELTRIVKIKIEAVFAVLSIESVTSEPAKISAGETANVKITLKNSADSLLRNIGVKLDLSNQSIPFAPVNSTTEKRLKFLAAGDQAELDFALIALPDSQAGVHKIPLTLSYSDALGTDYTKTDMISLIIGGAPELQTNIDETDVLKAGSSGSVSLRLINKGPVNIKFLTVQLLPSTSYEILSSDNIYIGDLDSDDYDTAEFKLYLKPDTESGSLTLPISLEYRDAMNNKFTERADVPVRIYTYDEARTFGLEKVNMTWTYVLVAVLLVLAYFGYKKRAVLKPALAKIRRRQRSELEKIRRAVSKKR